MKKILIILSVLFSTLLLPASLYASTYTNATYRGTIAINNSSTTAANVVVPCTINTTALVDAGMISSGLLDSTIISGSSDVTYMPEYGSTNWWLFVPSAPTGILNNTLYAGGSNDMSSKIRYIPGSTGMTTDDSPTLELGNNFEVDTKGYMDTAAGASKDILLKSSAFRVYVSGAQEITATTSSGWIWGDSFEENPAGDVWTDDALASDGNENTAAAVATNNVYLECTLPVPIPCSKVSHRWSSGYIPIVEVDAYYSGAWHNVYNGGGSINPTTIESNIGSTQTVSAIRAKVTTHTGAVYLWELEAWQEPVSVVATGITSGERRVVVSNDGSDLSMTVYDGAGEILDTDTATPSGVVPNNVNVYYVATNGSMSYLEYHKITIGGTLQQHITWQYGSTFQDQSAGNHDATPSYPSASSDPDVSASLTIFQPITQSQLNTYSVTGAGSILTSTVTAPATLYTELDTSKVPGAEAINTFLGLAGLTGQAQALWWFPFVFFIIAILGFLVYDATQRNGGEGSLLVMFVVMEVLLVAAGVIGTANTSSLIPLFPAILFPIPSSAIILSKKHIGWG